MKKLIISVIFISLFAYRSTATIRTVSNSALNPGQFTTIQAAINASTANDTILVQGTANAYAGFNVDRRLTIIGPGFNPLKDSPFTASVTSSSLNTASANGSVIEGFILNGNKFAISASCSNITFRRNYFVGNGLQMSAGGTYNGFLLEQNMFDNAEILFNCCTVSTVTNWIIRNNVFSSATCCNSSFLYNFGSVTNMLVQNNVFYSNGTSGRNVWNDDNCCGFNNAQFLLVNDNIFYNINVGKIANSIFTHNLTFNCTNNTPWSSNSNTDNGGNIANTSAAFVNQSTINAGATMSLVPAFYELSAGSPALSTGAGVNDMGVYGGQISWINANMPDIPFIQSMSLQSTTVPAGGNLQVNVITKKHD